MSILISAKLADKPFEIIQAKGATFERAVLNAARRLGLNKRYTFIAERNGERIKLGRELFGERLLSPELIVWEEEPETHRTLRSYSARYRERLV